MQTYDFWFWDLPEAGWGLGTAPSWCAPIKCKSRAHAEALAEAISKGNQPVVGNRVEVVDKKGLTRRWINGRVSHSTKDEWITDDGQGFSHDMIKTIGLP